MANVVDIHTMLPGGNTVQTAYSGSVVTVTDPVNRKIKRETDGLGRLIKVTEQDVTGALNQETTYAYDISDRLTLVNQGNQARTFKYDAEGRLLFERIPEMAAPINDSTGTTWSTKYTYTDWGALATKQDARGVITTYAYDALHRLTSVSYNTSGAEWVAATPTVTYNYDNVNNSPTKGLLLSMSVGSGYFETYAYDSNKRVASVTRTMDGRNYATSYQYNTANQPTQMTYPSGRVINLGHDNKGRLTSIGSFLSSVTYNGIGQVAGLVLGNGVTESYGYEANRMQLTLQTATKNGGPANGLMNLTYGYQASAGQMGAGSTAGNAGQVMSISGTINGTTEGASYTYDLLGRLTTSNQTSNGASAQRRFSYDRWRNRMSVWDAVSGGNQIQSIVLQQSGGAPTNRLTSATTSGVTASYTYDAAGNVTNDGVRTYSFDGENRIVSVDGGATAGYAYDASNQRYKKATVGSTTHYVWQGSQVIAEHDGSTGGSIADYVYSGSRMIAKASGPTAQYSVSDRLSVRMTLNSSGSVLGRQTHLPFGEDFGESGTQEKHHFANYEREGESGLDYSVNRWYSSSIGRFLSVDPITGTGPQRTNRYGYSMNDPTNLFDPDGRNIYFLSCHANIWWTYTNGEPQAHAKGEICEVVDLGPAFISQPSDRSRQRKPRNFSLARLKECAETLFGVTMTSFDRAKDGKNGSFSGNGPDTVRHDGDNAPITVTIDVSINSAGLVAMWNQRTSPGPTQLRGAWFPDIPFTVFVASNLTLFPKSRRSPFKCMS